MTLFSLTFISCFKDEPLNMECDIQEAWIHYDNPSECTWNLSDTIHSNINTDASSLVFKVKPRTDRTALAPRFVITDGATISPADGSVHDFSAGPVVYTVTSQDGQWSRKYSVAVVEEGRTTRTEMNFSFERFREFQPEGSNSKYYVWSDLKEDGTEANNWATGNAGFKISNSLAKPDEYPSVPVADGYEGYAVKLETKSTGPIAAVRNMRLAAGNLFLGDFDATNALEKPRECTRFGLPFDKKPLRFSGWYKYTPGKEFQNIDGTIVPGKTDAADIYAVLYRNHDAAGNPIVLQGDDVKTNPAIVALAQVQQIGAPTQWTEFEADFIYYGGELDQDLLANFGYSLAVVFSSSVDGAWFQGAIGSTLYIDEVKIICEQEY